MSDLIDRQAAIDALDEQIEQCNKSLSSFDISMKDEYAVKVERASLVAFREILEYLPPAQLSTNLAEAGMDCISRQAAIDALRAMQTYKLFAGDDMLLIDQAGAQTELMVLPPAQPAPSQVAADIARIVENGKDMRVIAQPEIIYCKDCKKQNRHYHESPYKDTVCPLTAWRGTAQGHEYDYQFCCFAERREMTDADEPAQPERIKGHWIKISPANIYECSECGKSVMTNDICAYDFCHGCGADMREVAT